MRRRDWPKCHFCEKDAEYDGWYRKRDLAGLETGLVQRIYVCEEHKGQLIGKVLEKEEEERMELKEITIPLDKGEIWCLPYLYKGMLGVELSFTWEDKEGSLILDNIVYVIQFYGVLTAVPGPKRFLVNDTEVLSAGWGDRLFLLIKDIDSTEAAFSVYLTTEQVMELWKLLEPLITDYVKQTGSEEA